MKKLLYLLIVIISIVFISNIDVYAKSYDVKIDNISLTEKSDKVVEREKPSFKDNNLNVSLSFKEVGDYALYKVTINNKENEKYKVVFESKDDYIKYESDNDIIKPNSKTDFLIKVIYNKQISSENVGIEKTSSIKFSIIDKDGNIVNPSTGINYELVLLVLLIIGTGIALSIKKKSALLILLLIPFSVFAIKTLSFTLNTKYIIDMKGFRYNGLLLDNLGEQVKTNIESMCHSNSNASKSNNNDYVIINKDNMKFDNIKYYSRSDCIADITLNYPNRFDNLKISNSVTIETDTETGANNLVIGECTFNPDYDYTKFTLDGEIINESTRVLLSNYISSNLCSQYKNALESIDKECYASIIESFTDR